MQGDHLVGKYCCLLCAKEFSSESGVKYHILKAHAEVGGLGRHVAPAQSARWAASGGGMGQDETGPPDRIKAGQGGCLSGQLPPRGLALSPGTGP